jgi:hypothetical protein
MSKDENIIDHINKNSLYRYQLLEEYKTILDLIEEDSNKLKNIREIYGQLERETFNFYEPIDKYWREDFHEIILLQILNPKTKEIGKIEYLNLFTDLLYAINNNYDHAYKFTRNVVVENQIGDKEHGFIDILISDEKNAIIIESKIHGAEDQKNQLARYYRYVRDILNKKVMAIVYIRPVDDENKMPPFDEYTKEYKNEIESIKNLLIPVSVVDSINQIDFVHGFLDTCYNFENIDKAKIYIKQYSELLKIMGGNKMTMSVEKEIFKKLFGDVGSVIKTTDVGEIWDNRWLILAVIIQDKLAKEMGFKPDGERYCYKKINEKINLTFIYDPDSKKIGDDFIFGFSYDSINQKTKKELENLLKGIGFENLLDENVENIDEWLIIRRLYITIDRPVNEIINDIQKIYTSLEKNINKILDKV